jgi:hypothetical protein
MANGLPVHDKFVFVNSGSQEEKPHPSSAAGVQERQSSPLAKASGNSHSSCLVSVELNADRPQFFLASIDGFPHNISFRISLRIDGHDRHGGFSICRGGSSSLPRASSAPNSGVLVFESLFEKSIPEPRSRQEQFESKVVSFRPLFSSAKLRP